MTRWFVFLLLTLICAAEESEEVRKYHDLLRKKPESGIVYERFVNAWLSEGNREGLQEWLKKRASAGNSGDWQILARFHDESGEDGLALSALDEAVKRDLEKAGLRVERARLRAAGDDLEGALKDLDLALNDEAVGRAAARLMGSLLARAGRVEEAGEVWQDLLSRFPTDENLREDLIEMQLEESLFEKAMETSKALISGTKDPYKKALRQLRLAEIFGLAEQGDEELKTYREVLARSGEGTWLEREVLTKLEQIHLREGDVQGLRDAFQSLREIYPQRVSIRKALAHQMARNGEFPEAVALFKEVLKVTPGDLGNREEFIAFLETNEKWDEALVELGELIKRKGDDALLWDRVLGIEASLKNRDGMLVALGKLRELKMSNVSEVIAVAARYRQFDFLAQAEEILKEGRVRFAESAELTRALAALFARTDREEKALPLWLASAGSKRENILASARAMAAHRFGKEAFQLLLDKVRELPGDRLLLTSLGQFALTPEQAVEAIPFMLALVELAESSTDLEKDVSLAASVIFRSEKSLEIIARLEKREALSGASRCLLAELEAGQGDWIKAARILKEGRDFLSQLYRARFAERRGDLTEAIILLEGFRKDAGTQKTLHLRRLVALYEREQRLAEALQRVEEWRRLSPGDRVAWATRARLLMEAGKREEAIADYRRVLARFGGLEDDRLRLAKALQSIGKFAEAGKQYRKLYELAEDRASRLKWVTRWATSMQSIRRVGEVVEVLRARSKSNRKSAGPLLALAEVYRIANDFENRTQVLLEAVRREPKNWEILSALALEAERDGELENAISLLKEAAIFDQSTRSQEALASFLMRHDRVEESLAILNAIPGAGDDPRFVEKTVIRLAKAEKFEAGFQYLESALKRHPGDWRLRCLQALLLLLLEKPEEACDLFRSLDRVVLPLANVPQGINWQASSREFEGKGFSPGVVELLTAQRVVFERMRLTHGFDLPTTSEDLRTFAFLVSAKLLSFREDEDGRRAFDELLETSSEDRRLYLLSEYRDEDYRKLLFKKIEEYPDELNFARLLLFTAELELEKERELIDQSLALIRKKVPLEVLENLDLLTEQGVIEGDNFAEFVMGLYRELAPADRLVAHEKLADLFVKMEGSEEAIESRIPKYDELLTFIADEIIQRKSPLPKVRFYQLHLQSLLSAGKGEEAVALLNRLVDWDKAGHFPTGQKVSIRGRRSQSRPIFPETPNAPIDRWISFVDLFSQSQTYRREGADRESQLALLREISNSQEAEKAIPHDGLAVLVEQAGRISSRHDRALVLLYASDERSQKLLVDLVSEMEKGDDPIELRFATAYHWDNEDLVRAYQLLIRISDLTLPKPLQQEVKGNLVSVAGELTKEELAKVDLKPARQALLQLHSRSPVRNVVSLMKKLGLVEQAERAERIIKARIAKPRQNRRVSQKRGLAGTQPSEIGRLLVEGKIEEAATKVEAITGLLAGRSNQNRNWEKWFELFANPKRPEFQESLLKRLRPIGKGTGEMWMRFAFAARVLKNEEVAFEAYREVVKLAPDNDEARIEVFLRKPAAERDWTIFSPKVTQERAEQLCSQLAGRFGGRSWSKEEKESYALMLETVRAAKIFLRDGGNVEHVDDPFGDAWLLNFCDEAMGIHQIEGFHLRPLKRPIGRNVIEVDEEKLQERKREFRELFELMVQSRGSSGKGFFCLWQASEELGVADDELFHFANQAIKTKVSIFSEEKIEPWRYDFLTLIHSRPFNYLLKTGKRFPRKIFSKEIAALLRENVPEVYELYQFTCELKEAERGESDEVMKKIIAALPEEDQSRASALGVFIKLARAFRPGEGAWIAGIQDEILRGYRRNREFNGTLWAWAELLRENHGRDAFAGLIADFADLNLGDPERWPALKKLLPQYRPKAVQEGLDQFEETVTNLSVVSSLREPLAVEMRRLKLDYFGFAAMKTLREAWAETDPSDAASFLSWLKTEGGLARRAGGEVADPIRLLAMIDALNLATLRSLDPNLEKVLEEDKDLDPLMKAVLQSFLDFPADTPLLFEKHFATIESLSQVAPFETWDLIFKWFPELDFTGLTPAAVAFLEKMSGDMQRRALERLAAEEGDILDHETPKETLFKVARYAPEQAALFLERRFEEKADLGEEWAIDIFNLLKERLRSETAAFSLIDFTKMIHPLLHGKVGNHALAFMTESSDQYFGNYLEKDLESRLEDSAKGSPLRRRLEALRPSLSKLSAGERRTLILILFSSRDPSKWRSPVVDGVPTDWEWLNREYRKDFPEIADFFSGFLSRPNPFELEKYSKLGSACLLKFLEEAELPPALQVRAARLIVSEYRLDLHFKKAGHWDWLAGCLEAYLASPSETDTRHALEILASIDASLLRGLGESPDRFLKAAVASIIREGHRGNPVHLFEKALTQFTGILATGGYEKMLQELVEALPQDFERDLPLQWMIFEKGYGSLLPGRFDASRGLSRITYRLPKYGRDSPEKIRAFLQFFPSQDRYFLEVLLSAAKDVEGQNAPALSREKRKLALARRYPAEAPERAEKSLPFLSYFCTDAECRAFVIDDLRAVEKEHLIASLGTSPADVNTEEYRSYLRTIIRAVLEEDVREGRSESALRQYRSILGSGEDGMERKAFEILEYLAFASFQSSFEQPENAKKFVVIFEEVFRETIRLPDSKFSRIASCAEGLALLQHLLAGDENGWQKMIDGLSGVTLANLREVRAKHPFFHIEPIRRNQRWRGESGLPWRKVLQMKLLSSNRFIAMAEANPGQMWTVLNAKILVTWQENFALISELPAPISEEPLHLWLRSRDRKPGLLLEEKMALLTKAREGAKKAGLAKLEAEILVDHVQFLTSSNQNQAARKLAGEIKLDLVFSKERSSQMRKIMSEGAKRK